MKRIIVFGGNHHNTLGVIRSLGRKGIFSEVLLHDKLPIKECNVLRSKYIKSWNKIDTVEEGINYLYSNRSQHEKPIIICSSDGAASAIDMHYEELNDYYHIPNCGQQGVITELMNKEKMATLAEKCGLLCPKTYVIDEYATFDINNITFPIITKPLLSIEGNKSEITICNNNTELKRFVNTHRNGRFQIQQFIQKQFEYQLIGCSLDGGKHIIIPGRSKIITQPVCTNTGFLHYEQLDGQEPIDACYQFLREINYSGLFSLEFLRDKDGKNYFMEINFRNDGNSICVTEAGVNLHYIWYAFHTQIDWETEARLNIHNIFVMPEFTELSLWYQGIIGPTRFIKEMRQADVFMDYSKDDPAPTYGFKKFSKNFILYLMKKPLYIFKHKLLQIDN